MDGARSQLSSYINPSENIFNMELTVTASTVITITEPTNPNSNNAPIEVMTIEIDNLKEYITTTVGKFSNYLFNVKRKYT